MLVLLKKDCGIYLKGDVIEMARAKGQQYINGGFAEEVVPTVVEPEPKPEPKKAPAKKKAPVKKAAKK